MLPVRPRHRHVHASLVIRMTSLYFYVGPDARPAEPAPSQHRHTLATRRSTTTTRARRPIAATHRPNARLKRRLLARLARTARATALIRVDLR